MLVWGGNDAGGATATGRRYIPATNTWSALSSNGAPSARTSHTAVFTGSQMVIWGGLDGAFVNSGARYNPVNNTWTLTTATGAPAIPPGLVPAAVPDDAGATATANPRGRNA